MKYNYRNQRLSLNNLDAGRDTWHCEDGVYAESVILIGVEYEEGTGERRQAPEQHMACRQEKTHKRCDHSDNWSNTEPFHRKTAVRFAFIKPTNTLENKTTA